MKKEIYNNSKNEYINKQKRKENNFQIIEKYIPLLIKDTKDENSQKMLLIKQQIIEKQKIKKMMKQKEKIVQIVNKEEEEQIEETKKNKQQQQNQSNNIMQQQHNINNQQQKIKVILPTFNKSISEESDNLNNNTSQPIIEEDQTTNKISHNKQVLTSSIITQSQSQTSSENIQTTQNKTKSSIQLGQIVKDQPQSPKFTKLYKPTNPSQFQFFKEYRDGNNEINIAPSSAGNQSIANSNEYQQARDKIQQNKLYDLNIIMKTKSYRNDSLQKIVPRQNPQLNTPEMINSQWEQQHHL